MGWRGGRRHPFICSGSGGGSSGSGSSGGSSGGGSSGGSSGGLRRRCSSMPLPPLPRASLLACRRPQGASCAASLIIAKARHRMKGMNIFDRCM
jgi:hypothetical protein